MKKQIFVIAFTLIFGCVAMAQQDPQYTNFMHYQFGFNPAFAGNSGKIKGMLINRYQWVGLEGAPKQLAITADTPFRLISPNSGIGLNIVSDELGFEKNTFVNLSYSHFFPISLGKLSIGASIGIVNKNINGDWYSPSGANDIYSYIYQDASSDLAVPQDEVSEMAFDIGLGALLSNNKYYVGLSTTHINSPRIIINDNQYIYLARHYYLVGGYNIKLADPLFEVQPSFLFKSDGASWQLDVGTNVVYDNRFSLGMSYRVDDAIALLLGAELFNGMRVGFSYDLITSAIGYYASGSYEMFISYSLDLKKGRKKKYKSIRYL